MTGEMFIPTISSVSSENEPYYEKRVMRLLLIRMLLAGATCIGVPVMTLGGNALQFGGNSYGTGTYVNIPGSAAYSFASGDFTIEMWIDPDLLVGDWRMLFCNSVENDCQLNINPGGGLEFYAGHVPGSPTILTGDLTWTLGQWYHVAVTRRSGVLRLYRDTVELISTSYSGSIGNSTDVNLGWRSFDVRHPFNGLIDEVRVWNVGWTQAELGANFKTEVDPSAAGLVGYWRFDEASGDQTVADLSPTGAEGILGANSSPGSDDPIRIASTVPLVGGDAPECLSGFTNLSGHLAEAICRLSLQGDDNEWARAELSTSLPSSFTLTVSLVRPGTNQFYDWTGFIVGDNTASDATAPSGLRILTSFENKLVVQDASSPSLYGGVTYFSDPTPWDLNVPISISVVSNGISIYVWVDDNLLGSVPMVLSHTRLTLVSFDNDEAGVFRNLTAGAWAPGFTTTPSSDTADVFYFKQADLDMDNHPDIVYTGSTSDSLYVIYGKADGTLEKPHAYFKIKKAALSVDYIDRDTLLDIVARTTSQVYILLNQGSRDFHLDSIPLSSLKYGRSPASSSFPSIATGYFNGDAWKDVVVSPGTILYGNGSGGFPSNSTLPFALDAVGSADFDNDGDDDLIATVGDSARILLNNGSGTMTQSSTTRIGYYLFDVSSVVTGTDFNKDGNPDFAVVTGQSVPGSNDTSRVTIALGNGTGGVQSTDSIRIIGSAINLAVNDVNRDRNLDLTIVNARTRTLEIYNGNGLGSFPDSSSSYLGSGTQALLALVTADVNRDGNPDYVSGGATAPVIIATNQIPSKPVRPEEMIVTGYGGIDFTVTNPLQFTISKSFSTVAGSAYWQADLNNDSIRDVRTFDYNLMNGEYRFLIKFPPDFSGNHFTMDIRVDGSEQVKPFLNYSLPTLLAASPQSTDSLVFYFIQETTPSMNPPNGKRTQTTRRPVFQWGKLVDSAHSTKYQIQLSTDYDLSSILYNDSTLTKPQFVPATPLDTGKVYYWRARSYNGSIWSSWTRTMAAYIGTGCCVGSSGDVNMAGIVDLADLSALVSFLTGGGYTLPCQGEANVNALGIVDLADLSALVAYLTGGGYVLPSCL